jgi:hypothetical protein
MAVKINILSLPFKVIFVRVRVKQRTYCPLVSAMEMAIWQAILT